MPFLLPQRSWPGARPRETQAALNPTAPLLLYGSTLSGKEQERVEAFVLSCSTEKGRKHSVSELTFFLGFTA